MAPISSFNATMATSQTEAACTARRQKAFANLQAKAQSIGWICLDSGWHGKDEQYRFVCRQGHSLVRVAQIFLSKSGVCAQCKDQERLQILQQWALQHGGRCLEVQYLGKQPHRFQCAAGHQWLTKPATIRSGKTWCPHCNHQRQRDAKIRKDGLSSLQQAATEKGGRCLSAEYTGVQSKYLFECARGHQWQTLGARILRGCWCLQCTRMDHGGKKRLKNGMARLQQIAHDKGGAVLSESYTRSHDPYRFRCAKAHEWEAQAAAIFRGGWCPQCMHDSLRLDIGELKQIAIDRGGLCLSDEYVKNNLPLLWECHRGHQWKANAAVIRRGNWCNQCAILARCTDPNSKARLKYLVDKTTAVDLT